MAGIAADVSFRQLLDAAPAWSSLAAAAESGLLHALLTSAATGPELARGLGLAPHANALVLEVLEAYGVVERRGDQFTASPELHEYAAGGVGMHMQLALHTHEFLRTGAPVTVMDGTPPERGAAYRAVAPRLESIFADLATALADALGPGTERVLDIGAGSGVWGFALAEAWPCTRVTALDLPEVAPGIAERARERGLGDRVRVLAGDYLDTAYREAPDEGGYDVVVLGNVLHLEPPERARALVARAWSARSPSGRLVVVDTLRGPAAPNRVRSLYALVLAMRTRCGRVHGFDELSGWLRAVGAVEVARLPLPSGGQVAELTDVVVAR